eukprot:180213-Chlamydomonas_euryale.AAC.3
MPCPETRHAASGSEHPAPPAPMPLRQVGEFMLAMCLPVWTCVDDKPPSRRGMHRFHLSSS